MRTVSLNLSRKWRSQNFDQIVGQNLTVRILKNSLYLDHFFPVYLFAGQRGCGKTSTARVFAAAINCQKLPSFQKDPKKSVVPCLVCESCVAMRDGNHPDFIEIDAASHTGVDNIRNIIESSSFLPLIGRKRVYLIDEAHMLSKAAFNAALKILEEPPSTALFILATTNPHKIIDTVRSRCFQLFFTPIGQDPLRNHLQEICKKENIAHDSQALDLIVRHTQGSARDALNLLEQVRFSSSCVSKDAVLILLGHIDDGDLVQIIDTTLHGTAAHLLQLLQALRIDQYSAEFVWERLLLMLRALLWIKYGANPVHITSSVNMIEPIAKKCCLVDVHKMIDVLYSHEELFFKTTQQHIFLEIILLSLCKKDTKKSDDEGGSASSMPSLPESNYQQTQNDSCDQEEGGDDASSQYETIGFCQQWSLFVTKMSTLGDPLIETLFKQARFVRYNEASHAVVIELSKDFVLFKERLFDAQNKWRPLLHELFSSQAVLEAQFTGINKFNKSSKQTSDVVHQPVQKRPTQVISSQEVQHKEKIVQPPVFTKQFSGASNGQQYKPKVVVSMQWKNESPIDVSDESVWKVAPMLLRYFPGVITEMRENR